LRLSLDTEVLPGPEDPREGAVAVPGELGGCDVLEDGEVLEKPEVLKGPGDPQACQSVRGRCVMSFPMKRMRPLSGV
jgi:hypothetical protein